MDQPTPDPTSDGRRRDPEAEGRGDVDDESTRPGDATTPAGGASVEGGPPDAAEDADDTPQADGTGDAGRHGAPARGMLVERAAAMGLEPAPPPRRTGVFVDVEELRAHVGGLLRSMLGGYEVDGLGNMTFAVEDARIFVTVGPGPMGPHVGVFSILTVDQPLTPELAAFLVTTNHRLAFGAFSYEPDQRAVWLRHSLLGATLDGPELRTAVISVATTAGRATSLLRERFGAGTFAEASEERQRAVHPPEPAHGEDDPVNASGYL